MVIYSLIFSLLIFWLNLFFLPALMPIWQINLLLVSGLIIAIFSGRIHWLLVLLTLFWESLILRQAAFGSILITQLLVWLSIEILLKSLRPINTKITVLIFIFCSTAIYAGSLKILSFFVYGKIGLNFILAAALANALLSLAV